MKSYLTQKDAIFEVLYAICKNSVYVNMQLYENDPYLGDQEVEKEVSKELNEPYIKILEKMKKELKK